MGQHNSSGIEGKELCGWQTTGLLGKSSLRNVNSTIVDGDADLSQMNCLCWEYIVIQFNVKAVGQEPF